MHCALCGQRTAHLVNDHDHETGLFRGCICNSCNVQEGYGGSNPLFVRWRLINPATIWHIEILMSHPVTHSAEDIEAGHKLMRRAIDSSHPTAPPRRSHAPAGLDHHLIRPGGNHDHDDLM
jgi:hypothetical protein